MRPDTRRAFNRESGGNRVSCQLWRTFFNAITVITLDYALSFDWSIRIFTTDLARTFEHVSTVKIFIRREM